MKRAISFISYILIICCFLSIVACTSSSVDLEDYKFGRLCLYYFIIIIKIVSKLTFKLAKIA